MKTTESKIMLFLFILILVSGAGMFLWGSFEDQNQVKDELKELNNVVEKESEQGTMNIKTVVNDLHHPWDIKLDKEDRIFFTQRQSGLYKYENEQKTEVYTPEDLYPAGEGGMLGFDLAPDFLESKKLFACFNSKDTDGNIRVVVSQFVLDETFSELESRKDIITDIPSAESGRHSGCRVVFDRNDENIIWIGTGDAADGEAPQDPNSLGGKVLRVNRDGKGVAGNLEEPYDDRIFSYGHRNIQGLTLFDKYDEIYGYGFTAEHGPDVDDEINPLVKGNFGWDPDLPYDESVPMTDKQKYPEAIESVWSSGKRTIAMCGVEYVESGVWNGDVLLAALKDRYILRYELNSEGKLVQKEEVVNSYGRIRQIYEAENGRIFFTTDNGGEDIIGEIVFE